MSGFNGYAIKKFGVVGMYVQQTGTYEDHFRRPYSTHMTGDVYNSILNQADSAGNITVAGIASIANDFIKPIATPESNTPILIPNGWQEKRLRYLLHIQSESVGGQILNEFLIGYTDVPGYAIKSNGQIALDPNMVFFINSINTTTSTLRQTPLGNMYYNNLVDSSHLLQNNSYQGAFSNDGRVYGLRPEDVFAQMEVGHIRNAADTDSFVYDTRGTIDQRTTKSKRENTIAPQYTATIINTLINTQQTVEHGSVIEHARRVVEPHDISRDAFLSFIRGKSGTLTCNNFRLSDLMSYDQNAANVINFINVDHPLYDNDTHVFNRGDNWHGSDATTLFATTLCNSLPSYMLSVGLTKIHFKSTNSTMGSVVDTKFVEIYGFNNEWDLTPEATKLKVRIDTELLRSLSYNGHIQFEIEALVNLIGETKLSISLNGEPARLFVCPSFGDALLTPIMTSDYNISSSIANDFEHLVDDIRGKTVGIDQSRYHNSSMGLDNQLQYNGQYDTQSSNGRHDNQIYSPLV